MTITLSTIVLAGLLGTLAMSLAMSLISLSWNASLDMVRAVGTLLTRSYEGSLLTGIVLHVLAGIFFAFIYTSVWQAFNFPYPQAFLFAGALTGFAHGFMVSFILTIGVVEHQPVAKFRTMGYTVPLGYIVGHTVYGVVVGAVVCASMI